LVSGTVAGIVALREEGGTQGPGRRPRDPSAAQRLHEDPVFRSTLHSRGAFE
jgi:hypothetical protein